MSLDTNLQSFATRVATELKSHKVLINNNAADLSALTTTEKGNLVAAINEVNSTIGILYASIGAAYKPGGTDVALADGGTGASLSDPGADRIMFWDDSANTVTWLTASTGLTISGTSMTVRSASDTQTGIVELATTAEAIAGTDTTRAVTPAGLAAAISSGTDLSSRVAKAGDTMTGPLTIANEDITSGGFTGSLRIGSSGAAHLAFDNNAVQAKSNNTNPTTLYLNPLGGSVWASGELRAASLYATQELELNTSSDRVKLFPEGQLVYYEYDPFDSAYSTVGTLELTASGLIYNGQLYASQSYVTTQINNLIDSAPGTLDTLNELAAALGDDPNFATTINTALGNRLRVDTAAQGLNSTQQANGRTNLDVWSKAEVGSVTTDYVTIFEAGLV